MRPDSSVHKEITRKLTINLLWISKLEVSSKELRSIFGALFCDSYELRYRSTISRLAATTASISSTARLGGKDLLMPSFRFMRMTYVD